MKICLSRHLYFANYISLFRVLFEKNDFEKKRNVFDRVAEIAFTKASR